MKDCLFCTESECNCNTARNVWDKRHESCGYCEDYNDFDCIINSHECHINIVKSAEFIIAQLRAEVERLKCCGNCEYLQVEGYGDEGNISLCYCSDGGEPLCDLDGVGIHPASRCPHWQPRKDSE